MYHGKHRHTLMFTAQFIRHHKNTVVKNIIEIATKPPLSQQTASV